MASPLTVQTVQYWAIGGKLSEDSTTIVWTNVATGETDAEISPLAANPRLTSIWDGRHGPGGFQSEDIKGLRVNASSVGDGEDITAVVMVKGSAVGNPLKVADVATGLAIKAKAAEGLQCTDGEAVAIITIQEGFAAGILSTVLEVMLVEADESAVTPNCRAGGARRPRGRR